MREIRIQAEPFDAAAEAARLTEGLAGAAGAVVAFTGLCRDEAGTLAALEIEHYPSMAEAELRRVAEEAAVRWPICGAKIIHRHGTIRPGEPIVLALTASRHRAAAIEAVSFLMDFLKTRAPFWKKEILHGSAAGGWVQAKNTDDEATKRWMRE